MSDRKLGIAFAGGGVRAASHLGVMQVLHENKIYPDAFAGASAGAIVASLLAYGYAPDKALYRFTEVNKNLVDIAYGHILKGIFTKDEIEGFIYGNNLEDAISKILNKSYLGEIKRPLGIITTDIDSGEQIIFSNIYFHDFDYKKVNDDNFRLMWSNDIVDFELSKILRASCGMPAIFIPKKIYGMKLVDGGISNNLPSDIVTAMGADKVLSLDLGYAGKIKTRGFLDIAHMSVNLLMERVTDGNSSEYGLYLNPKIYDVTALDTSKVAECFDRGYEYGKKELDRILSYLEE